jgi:hypothetical protein
MTFCTHPVETFVTIQIRQAIHGTCNVIMRRVRVTIIAVEKKYPGRTWKLTYDGLPIGNQDLRRRGNCKWEASPVKLTTGGEEVNRYSYRSETDRRRWESSCRLSHFDVEGKERPPHCDLRAATKVQRVWKVAVHLGYATVRYVRSRFGCQYWSCHWSVLLFHYIQSLNSGWSAMPVNCLIQFLFTMVL